MKKVILIVPDEIQHVIGSSRSRRVESENLSAVKIIEALCDRDDYHQYFYFESPDEVKVVSIVDCEEEEMAAAF
jgi:hypothetical protein